MHQFTNILLIVSLMTIALAEVVKFQDCKENVKCTVHEVRIDPCPEVAKNKPCRLVRHSNVTVSFDYTPQFGAQEATSKAFWSQNLMDLPFAGMDTEACKHTSCPVVEGQRQSYSYNLNVLKSFPPRAYDVKWKLMNEANEMCCFITQIEITKTKSGKH
ncbi:MD-2-related lipid-recognition protein-like [Toxorhynchites rutilus septentrionalis]|uniref:MD-2-related lipid-recognition protein-like n=1 Tax=Toxorhynchites rutilus septentrionalis TaxID=329112 RepID=UPI0024799930|nr:MD-2-related lipid-recognition protein-like [Toxorhynchites rutilus septentrionalis]